MALIGRENEKRILINALYSNRSELIVVYGRRRIGKTFLIREVYKKQIKFEFSGIYKTGLREQLKNFSLKLKSIGVKSKRPSDWFEAFQLLAGFIGQDKSKKKKVIFIDEFPWLDTRKSNFLAAFDNFWNTFVSARKDIVVVICGSAASYMINNIIKNTGGLHNRLTEKIQLAPFNLHETELMLKSKKVQLSRYDIIQVYMALGGVPHYLDKIMQGESVAQIIDRLCFEKNGFLRTEFENVFASFFANSDNHERIIRALASVRKGMTRNELLQKSKLISGGRLSKTLSELEESGFIECYTPYKGQTNSVYRLADEYSMFYLKFIEKSKPDKSGVWIKMMGKPSFKTWSGFSFETICIKHIDQIKAGLQIAGINSYHGSWISKKAEENHQIDLLIDRDDNVINLCEIKFSNSEFILDKSYAREIIDKQNTFIAESKTKKSVFVTFITTYGLKKNVHRQQYVQKELTMDALFIAL
ncbi:MAG: ATP-binding protein [Bacteroidales bacterium]|nr:ATP-binding protein [Bacteroidales bacterium]